jgi:5'-nucleotidase (lipoprotein e(P4) family)
MTYRRSLLAVAMLAPMGLSACIIMDREAEPVREVVIEREIVLEDGVPQNDMLNATLWAQQAVEYKATTDGIYALATLRLDEALSDPDWTAAPDLQGDAYQDLPPAIILDADETVLDNTPYAAAGILSGEEYSNESWAAWANAGVAKSVPGAVDFTRAAAAKGVKVFYITNRSVETEDGTARNLAALGFPMGGNVDTLLMLGEQKEGQAEKWPSAKSSRWAVVAKDYRILLMLGDNLGDFTDAYKGSPAERQAVYEANDGKWGREWIALPNPGYGSWETAPFGHDRSLPSDEKRALKRESLQPWPAQP